MSGALPSTRSLPPPMKTKIPIFSLNSTRLRIALLLMIGLFAGTSMRVNLSMAVVCMVNSTAFDQQESLISSNSSEFQNSCKAPQSSETLIAEGYSGNLLWTPKQISLLLSGTFYGALLTCWWSGILADRFGPKMVMLAGIADLALFTMLTPFLANTNFHALFIARFIMGLGEGFIFPSISSMSARWFPPSERSTFAAIYTSGNQMASTFALPTSSFLCGTTFLDGWPSIFYLFASIGCIWIIFWVFLSSNTPEKNIYISEEEILYIRQQTSGQNTTRKVGSNKLSTAPVPWMNMATSSAVYANIIAQFSFNFSASLLQTYLPTYMKQILKVEIGKNGVYAMLPFLTQLISKNIFGILSDALKRHNMLTSTQAVKIFQVTGNVGAFLCFLILAFFIDCTRIGLAVVIFAFYGIFFSAGIPGFFTSLLSVAPSFTGTLFSISMLAGNIGNAASPGLVGLINKHGTETEWMYIWLITAAINLIAAIVFSIYGSADIQEWAKPEFLEKSKVVPKYFVETPMKTIDLENQEKLGVIGRKKRISDVEPEDFIN